MAAKRHLIVKKSYRDRWAAAVVGALVVLLASGLVLLLGRNQPGPIPVNLKHQIKFVIFYPGQSADWRVETGSLKYDASQAVFSYVVDYGRTKLTVAEQATPQNFTDVPESYDKLLQSLHQYASFDSYYDRVALTRPEEFHGQQTALMTSKGTTVFAHATTGSLSDTQWKSWFNNLEVIR